MKPKFSIITVTRNDPEGLRRTLASIRAQTCEDREVIIIDGSPDGVSDSVIEEFPGLVATLERDLGKGIYPAMNQGVACARGAWVIFMNSGDRFLHPDVLRLFDAPDGAEVAFGRSRKPDGSVHLEFTGWEFLWKRMPFSHQATFCKASLLRDRPFSVRYGIAADYEFFLWAHKAGRVFHQLPIDVAETEPGGISDTRLIRRVWETYRAARTYFPHSQVHRFYFHKLKWAAKLQLSRKVGGLLRKRDARIASSAKAGKAE